MILRQKVFKDYNSQVKSIQPSSSPNSSLIISSFDSSSYGVSFGGGTINDPRLPSGLEKITEAGVGWIRVNFCSWDIAEPENDKWNFKRCDPLINKAVELNLNLLHGIVPSSQWSSSAPTECPAQLPNCSAKRILFPPNDYKDFEEFLYRLVSRYGVNDNGFGAGYGQKKIKYWEIGNEPDLQGYWPKGGFAEYAKWLNIAHDTIKRADPEAKVVLGGLSLGGTPGRLNEDFFENILDDKENPADENFDIANWHHYGKKEEAKVRMDYVVNKMKERGFTKPIWVTEVGSSASTEQEEESQSEYMLDIVPYLFGIGVDKVFWFQLYDDPPQKLSDSAFKGYGLLKNDLVNKVLVPKKAYFTYKELIQESE